MVVFQARGVYCCQETEKLGHVFFRVSEYINELAFVQPHVPCFSFSLFSKSFVFYNGYEEAHIDHGLFNFHSQKQHYFQDVDVAWHFFFSITCLHYIKDYDATQYAFSSNISIGVNAISDSLHI